MGLLDDLAAVRHHENVAIRFSGIGDDGRRDDGLTLSGRRHEQDTALAGCNLGLNAGDNLALIAPQ